MKNRTLLTIVFSLAAVLLFFIMLNSGRDTLLHRQEALLASARMPGESVDASIKAVDDEAMAPQTPLSLKYDRYPLTFVYFVVNQESVPIYSSPNSDKRILRTAQFREKLNYVETAVIREQAEDRQTPEGSGQTGEQVRVWYHVYWYEDKDGQPVADGSAAEAEKRFGFIAAGAAEKRRLRIDLMAEYVRKAEAFVSGGGVTCIANYQNGHGKPPLYKGKETDGQGNLRSQSAPGYPDLSAKEEFTYLADGTLVKVMEPLAKTGTKDAGTGGGYRRVLCLADGKEYYVPLKYIPDAEALPSLTKAVVIDRANQNEAVFERLPNGAGDSAPNGAGNNAGDSAGGDGQGSGQGGWTCVSYTLATTGTKSEYAVPTPLGYYMMMEKRPQFYYNKDGTTEVQGYAPYVLRFCGGAYIHGVPVSYEYKNGKRVTPPKKEYSPTMGTTPLSHKCVRNYTSHAKFLYDWFEEGKTAVIVIE